MNQEIKIGNYVEVILTDGTHIEGRMDEIKRDEGLCKIRMSDHQTTDWIPLDKVSLKNQP